MQRRIIPGLTLILLASANFAGLHAQPPDSALKKNGSPPPFEKIDVDGDGLISPDEAQLDRALSLHFDAFDTDNTNRLDRREYEKFKSY